jgi:glyoxylase-like metal-dependent hydrolase (beta-lactamase superfamily II)
MELYTLPVGFVAANCYLVAARADARAGTRAALVIDPGDEAEVILQAIQERRLSPALIVLTHFHFDHVQAAAGVCAATGAPLAIGAGDAEALAEPPVMFGARGPAGLRADRLLYEGDVLAVGDLEATVLATPGHSPGGISLYLPGEAAVFTGDVLFREGVGRTDLPRSAPRDLVASIRRLYALPDETVVYPGHGPATTIGHEKRHNPFVRA